MEYLELSKKDVEKISRDLAQKVKKQYDIDAVIFIARGAYQIGVAVADELGCPLIEIKAQRVGGGFKSFIKKFLEILPKFVKIKLRRIEINSGFHGKKTDRKISINEKQWKKYKDSKNILIVDDSIDTGNSMLLVKKYTEQYFSDSNVYIACLNVLDKGLEVIKPDFYLYTNTMLSGPWSNDSKYHAEFLKEYEEFERKYNE